MTLAAPSLFLAAGLGWLAGGTLLLAACRLRHRPVPPEMEDAWNAFVLWWVGLAAIPLFLSTSTFLAAVGVREVALHVLLHVSAWCLGAIGIAGLTFYYVYLFTGRRGLLAAVTAHYGLIVITISMLFIYTEPLSVELHDWRVELVRGTPSPAIVGVALALLGLVPPALGSVAYVSLAVQARDARTRYRVIMVTAGVASWIGLMLGGYALGFSQWSAWPLAIRAADLALGLTVLVAYHPPVPVRRRLNRSNAGAMGKGSECGGPRAWEQALHRAQDLV